MTTLALRQMPAIRLPRVRFRKPRLPPDLGIWCFAILTGTIITLLEAEILARASISASIGIARMLGFH